MTFVAALMSFQGQMWPWLSLLQGGCPCTSAVLGCSLHLVTGLTEGAGKAMGVVLKSNQPALFYQQATLLYVRQQETFKNLMPKFNNIF